MKTEQIALLAGMFFIVFGIVLRALQLMRPDPLTRRIEGLSMPLAGAAAGAGTNVGGLESPEENKWSERIVEVSKRVAKLSLPKDDWDRSALRRRFMYAGFRSAAAPAYYFAAKTVLALALPAAALLIAAPRLSAGHTLSALFVLLAASALGFYGPNIVLSRLVTSRQRSIIEALPDAVDLMTVCVEAGLGLDAAMLRVTPEGFRLDSYLASLSGGLVGLGLGFLATSTLGGSSPGSLDVALKVGAMAVGQGLFASGAYHLYEGYKPTATDLDKLPEHRTDDPILNWKLQRERRNP